MDLENFPLYIRKQDQINDIISYLYEYEKDRQKKYVQFLRLLQKVIYFDFGNVLFFWKNDDYYDLEFFCQIGWRKEIEQLYTSHYYSEDDVFPIFAKKTPVIMKSSDMFDETRTMSSYYASFMAIAKFDLSLECNIILADEENVYGICSLFRDFPKQDFTTEEKRVLEIIQPHLSNSAQIGMNQRKEDFFEEYAAQEPVSGDIVFTRTRKILKATEAFKKILYKYNSDCNLQGVIDHLLIKISDNTEQASAQMYKLPDIPVLAELQERSSDAHGQYIYCRIYDSKTITSSYIAHTEQTYQLSQKEMEILQLMLRGMSREEIAKALLYSVPTVKKHISSIYSKLSVNSFGQLLNKMEFF